MFIACPLPLPYPSPTPFLKNLKFYIYEESVLTQAFVNDKLTRDSPIEAPYYVTFADFLCSTVKPSTATH